MQTEDKERLEIDFWKNSQYESPDNFSVNNIIYKLWEAKVFLDKVDKEYKEIFEDATTILELGAGQGWASCILKSKFSSKRVIASDISEYAMASLPNWEKMFNCKLDQAIVCKSYEIPLPSKSVDLIFTFQSFHHFGKFKKTLAEIHRVLTDGGVCLLMYEPSCSNFIHPLAYKRVNAKRSAVPEDVLRFKEIEKIATELQFKNIEINFDPGIINRRPLQTIYYWLLSKLKFLQKIVPCSADYIFKK